MKKLFKNPLTRLFTPIGTVEKGKVQKNLFLMTVLPVLASLACANTLDVETNSYDIAYQNTQVVLDGKLNEGVWKGLKSLNFVNPWESSTMPDTQFKAYHDGQYFYFAFDVEDPNTVIFEKTHDEMMIARQDQVEIFFAQGAIDQVKADGRYPHYFALEMDYRGRVLSIKADSQKNRDVDWNMETLEIKGELTDKGYALEGHISLNELRKLGVIHDNRIQAGVYRAEFSIIKGKEVANWITWVNPNTEKPNFHINSSFGTFVLGKVE